MNATDRLHSRKETLEREITKIRDLLSRTMTELAACSDKVMREELQDRAGILQRNLNERCNKLDEIDMAIASDVRTRLSNSSG